MSLLRTIHKLRVPLLLAAVGCVYPTDNLRAEGRVEFVIVGRSQMGTNFQEWTRTLSEAGAARVQIRSGEASDKPGITVSGQPASPIYVVTTNFDAQGNLLLPGGGRFARGDGGRLARWIADLAQNGLPERRESKSAFGLTASQFQEVQKDLARPASVSTQGRSRAEAIQQIATRLSRPLRLETRTAEALAGDTVAEDLSALSCGTTLACLLRPAGYCLVPQASGKEVQYLVVPSKGLSTIWPVGWEPKQEDRELLPALFEFLNVNIQNVPAATAMEAIAKRLKVPLLLDHNALARHGLDPKKTMVTLPSGRSTHSLTLRKVLFQTGLKFEVRVDEADHPFLWVTSIKPL